ncbi:MAG: 4-phosphoerythronate dehydrogenase [Porticoccaceae bacterium]|nr:4-phosphoerythronate dehydrogenase [Porticoccaceae bacterium]
MNRPRIIADQNMPLVEAHFGHLGEVELMAGRDIDRHSIEGAEILLVRSVTQVNQSLLEGSSVRFVGSATAGTDHIDLDYLAENGIQFAHAPGCNAEAVAQYALSVFSRLKPRWLESKVGIVGCGNVGGRLYQKLVALGVDCQVYDPFLSQSQIPDLVSFDQILDCEIITLHTPLTTEGQFPTHHMFNQQVLAQLKPNSLLINAGRGAVIDNLALIDRLKQSDNLQVALDVWEPEPEINAELLDLVSIATPHIAGYSNEGKIRGTTMLYDAVCRLYLDDQSTQNSNNLTKDKKDSIEATGKTLNQLLVECYNVQADDLRMRERLKQGDIGQAFDQLRKNYPQRREYSHFAVSADTALSRQLKILGYSTD